MSRIDTPPGFAVYPSASPKAANLPAVDQVLAFEQALGGEPPAAGRRRGGVGNGPRGARQLPRVAPP
ncbi:hypothetical protein ACRCPW_26600, partial [Pseudomonas aeruginosa]